MKKVERAFTLADVRSLAGKPSFDAARGAFITAKKAADGTVTALAGRVEEFTHSVTPLLRSRSVEVAGAHNRELRRTASRSGSLF
jgi:hypothetical protein